MKLIKKLHGLFPNGQEITGEEKWSEEETKLDINSVTHGILDGDRVANLDINSGTHGILDRDRVDIEVGGRNLLKDSGLEVSNGSYNIARYDLTDDIKADEEVTLTLWGELASTKSSFRVYNSGGSVRLANLADNGDGTYSATFKWIIGSSTNTRLWVYAFTNAQTGVSTINKIKLEKGNIATDWTPAPEDLATRTHTHPWSEVSDKPSTFPPSSHTHSAGDISTGVLADSRIPNLGANKITSGTFDIDRIPMISSDKLIDNQVPKFLSVSNGSDLNSARTSGWYRLGGTGAYTNGPLGGSGHYGILDVKSDGSPSGICVQEYTHSSGAVYRRVSGSNGTWTTWVRVV